MVFGDITTPTDVLIGERAPEDLSHLVLELNKDVVMPVSGGTVPFTAANASIISASTNGANLWRNDSLTTDAVGAYCIGADLWGPLQNGANSLAYIYDQSNALQIGALAQAISGGWVAWNLEFDLVSTIASTSGPTFFVSVALSSVTLTLKPGSRFWIYQFA